MLQIHVTDERGVVTSILATEFPLLIGRSPHAGLRLESSGVWEEHARISLVQSSRAPSEHRFFLESLGQSLVSVNGQITPTKELAIGDEILLGAARLTVSLAPAAQKKLAVHEWFVWGLLIIIVLVEATVIHFAQ